MKKKIAIIVIFVFSLVFSIIGWPLLAKIDSKVNLDENRNPTPFPEFNNEFFLNFDNYFIDRVPIRKSSIKNMTNIELALNKIYNKILLSLNIDDYYITQNQVVFGENDWLFYTGDNSIEHYKGTNLPSQEELDVYLNRVQKVGNYFESIGKEFVIYVAPNKERMYAENMPKGIKVVSETKRIDLIKQHIDQNSNVKMVYPYLELTEQKNIEQQLYYKWDTHWNKLGAYYAFCELYSAIGGEAAPISYECKNIFADRDLQLMIAKEKGEDLEYFTNYRPEISCQISLDGSKYISKSNNPNGKKLLLFGDSFRIVGTIDYLSKEFTDCIMADRLLDIHSFLSGQWGVGFEEYDVIVLECVERFQNDIFGDEGTLQKIINELGL